jgi:hypothetical protein
MLYRSDWNIAIKMIVDNMAKMGATQQQIRDKVINIIHSDAFQYQIKYAYEAWLKKGIWFFQAILEQLGGVL